MPGKSFRRGTNLCHLFSMFSCSFPMVFLHASIFVTFDIQWKGVVKRLGKYWCGFIELSKTDAIHGKASISSLICGHIHNWNWE